MLVSFSVNSMVGLVPSGASSATNINLPDSKIINLNKERKVVMYEHCEVHRQFPHVVTVL